MKITKKTGDPLWWAAQRGGCCLRQSHLSERSKRQVDLSDVICSNIDLDVDGTLQVQLAGVHDQNVVEEIWWSRLSWTFLQQTPHGEDALPGKPPGLTLIKNMSSSTFCNQDFLVDAPDDINIEAGSSKYRHQNKKVANDSLYNPDKNDFISHLSRPTELTGPLKPCHAEFLQTLMAEYRGTRLTLVLINFWPYNYDVQILSGLRQSKNLTGGNASAVH